MEFSIEKHEMTIIEVEGMIVKPYKVEKLQINSGQRYSVLITTNQVPLNFWMYIKGKRHKM